MNPSKSAQDVLRCHLCETPVPPLSCEVCDIYLCKGCVADHILDESSEHKVVPIKQSLSAFIYPKCLKHFSRNCELYCEQCTIPICVQCASTQGHRGHGFKDLLEFAVRRREASQTDLKELESSILIEHKEFASRIRNQKANLGNTLEELKKSIDEHAEKLQKQVSDVVEKLKSDVVKKHQERIAALTKTEEQNAFTISDIEKCILGVQELQTSRDLCCVLEYKSRNEELRKTPPNLNVTLPTFVAYDITNDKLNELFGSLTMASYDRKTLEEDVKSMSLKAKDVEKELERGKYQHKKKKTKSRNSGLRGYSEAASKSASKTMDTYVESSPAALGWRGYSFAASGTAALETMGTYVGSSPTGWEEYIESASKSAAKTRDTDVDFSAINSPWASPNSPNGQTKCLKSEWEEYSESASKSAAKTEDTDVDFSAVSSPWASPNSPNGQTKCLKSEWGGYSESPSKLAAKTRDTDDDFSAVNSSWRPAAGRLPSHPY